MQNGTVTMETSLAAYYSNLTLYDQEGPFLRYLWGEGGEAHIYPPKDLYGDVCSCFIYNSPKLEQPKYPSTSEWINNYGI